MNHVVYVASTQFCHRGMKIAIDKKNECEWLCSSKSLQKQVKGWIWPERPFAESGLQVCNDGSMAEVFTFPVKSVR